MHLLAALPAAHPVAVAASANNAINTKRPATSVRRAIVQVIDVESSAGPDLSPPGVEWCDEGYVGMFRLHSESCPKSSAVVTREPQCECRGYVTSVPSPVDNPV